MTADVTPNRMNWPSQFTGILDCFISVFKMSRSLRAALSGYQREVERRTSQPASARKNGRYS